MYRTNKIHKINQNKKNLNKNQKKNLKKMMK